MNEIKFDSLRVAEIKMTMTPGPHDDLKADLYGRTFIRDNVKDIVIDFCLDRTPISADVVFYFKQPIDLELFQELLSRWYKHSPTVIRDYYFKWSEHGGLMSGIKPADKYINVHFINCDFHPNCKNHVVFEDCQFTDCDMPWME